MTDHHRRAAGSLEAEVMTVLQEAGRPLSPGDVQERLAGELAYTTVLTILTRMHAKNLVTRMKNGRSYVYRPVDDESGLTARRMRQVMEGGPDREAVLARFVDGLSPDDERVLRALLGP
ncbi:BlaI/MecI/CopY family transcriptional regulator [Herbidospora sp. RD11066]